MTELTAEPQDYSQNYAQNYASTRTPPHSALRRGADPLILSLVIAVMTLCVSGAVIGDHLAHLPDIDSLFQPKLVQTTPPLAQINMLQVMDAKNLDTSKGVAEIDAAPAAPVSTEPYPVQAQTAHHAEAATFHKDRALAEYLLN